MKHVTPSLTEEVARPCQKEENEEENEEEDEDLKWWLSLSLDQFILRGAIGVVL